MNDSEKWLLDRGALQRSDPNFWRLGLINVWQDAGQWCATHQCYDEPFGEGATPEAAIKGLAAEIRKYAEDIKDEANRVEGTLDPNYRSQE